MIIDGGDVTDALDRLRQDLAGRYTIEREVGAGGMARVYAAQDLRHRRKVAIKVLRPELTEALGSERFLREIETSANLRHPHILPLFDSGEAGDFLFFVMPFVDGESLRARIARERQLPIDEALRIAHEIADALNYAHSQGIVHRDIKPENVLLESGHAVVADFGIAHAERRGGAQTLTQTGSSLGTPRYMSPEQAAGDKVVDGRADQYSLACVLYEMLAGQPPFTGPTFERTIYQQLVDTPPPITRFRPTVSAAVSAAVSRALSKSPSDRFSSASAFADALRSPIADRPAARSVAVLPFLNLSADPENEFFADGITEDVIAQLSKIRSLKVVSRTSVMPFKKRDHDLREIASKLHVNALLEGSVRRAGTRVRIVAQLIDAEHDQHLWAETFDRNLTDIFEIQSEVALRIASALQTRLSADERQRIARPPTSDLHAYTLYLQGRQQLLRFTTQSMKRSIEFFERAVAHDPTFAPAFAGIATAYTELGETGSLPPNEAYPRAQEAATKALALDDDLSDAHRTLAHIKLVNDFDWEGAEFEFKRALALNPSNADAYDLYGRLCSAQERHAEAIALQQRAHELDPFVNKVDVATAYLRAGRYDDAAESAQLAVELDPLDPRAHCTLGWVYLGQGKTAEGLAQIEEAVELSPGHSLWLAQLGEAHGLHGQPDKARTVLDRLIELAKTSYVSPYHFAYVYSGLGEVDRAMDYLEQAFEHRSGAVYGIKGSFLFVPLRGHPRFAALLRKMNLT